MLHLARGQLNRAYRQHGLVAPNPLPTRDWFGADPAELDDPAAMGIERARAKFKDAFSAWEGAMPGKLVEPVLDILRKTHAALLAQSHSEAAKRAVLEAHDMLRDAATDPGGRETGGRGASWPGSG